MEMEDRIAELQLQRQSLQELIATLKDGRGAAKVAEWHAKIDAIRLAELKQKRLNSKLNQQVSGSVAIKLEKQVVYFTFGLSLDSV